MISRLLVFVLALLVFATPATAQQGTVNARCLVNTVAPTYGDSTYQFISCDTSGGLRIGGTVTTTPPANATTNVTQFGSSNVVTGIGASGAGVPRFSLSNDSVLAANQSVAQRQPTTGAVIADLAVTTTSQQLVASDVTRLGITCTNTDATNGIRWGPGSTPTATSGVLLKPGASISDTGTYAVNVIRDTAATSNPTISCSRSNT